MDAVNCKVNFFNNPITRSIPWSCGLDAEFLGNLYVPYGTLSIGGDYSTPPTTTGMEIVGGYSYKFGNGGSIYLSQVSFIYIFGNATNTGINIQTITFPNPYANISKLINNTSIDTGDNSTYIFCHTTTNITTTSIDINIVELSPNAGDMWYLPTLNVHILINELF